MPLNIKRGQKDSSHHTAEMKKIRQKPNPQTDIQVLLATLNRGLCKHIFLNSFDGQGAIRDGHE